MQMVGTTAFPNFSITMRSYSKNLYQIVQPHLARYWSHFISFPLIHDFQQIGFLSFHLVF